MKTREEIEREIVLYEKRQQDLRLADVLEREQRNASWFWQCPAKAIEYPLSIWHESTGKWQL